MRPRAGVTTTCCPLCGRPMYPCPVCGGDLPEKGNKRRRVPQRAGKLLLVHADCAPLVDAQGELDVEDAA